MEQGLPSILILFCHPRFEQSRVNRALLEAVSDLPCVQVHDLYETYPDFNIQVEREKGLLLTARVVIWQHPFYLFGAPALLKQWLDLVLEFGWAHGQEGNALKDKWVFNVVTTGGARESYRPEGRNRFALRDFLVPFDQTANQCKMTYLPPFAVQGTYLLTQAELARHAERYRMLLQRLVQEGLQTEGMMRFSLMNDWLDATGEGGTS